MRRWFGLYLLLVCTVPVGLSVVGCAKKNTTVYCNAGDSGPIVGQISNISLSPNLVLSGESLNYGQIGAGLSATAQDCKGTSVATSSYTYATSNMAIADINPANGSVCGGSWNRNSGGGVVDYTICTPPATGITTVAYVTASSGGATSNPIAVYVHPVVTGVALAPPSTACFSDPQGPTTNCCPGTGTSITSPAYSGDRCVSQNQSVQIAARVYAGVGTSPANNITCQVGHVSFAPQGSGNIVTIDQNGIATANQPGSVLIAATVSNAPSASSAGFFSTCPPASITLQPAGGVTAPGGNLTVTLNTNQALTATVVDTANQPLTGLSLEFNSTTPQTINATSGSILATFPGTATITAVCQPPSCNPSPFSQTGLYGNGKSVTSNGLTATAAGNTGSVIYIGSTSSQYLLPVDFTVNQPGSLVRLPYTPNSMVITQDGSTIYMGSPQGLMTFSAASNSVTGVSQAVPGTVLSISPDGSTIVVTDPTRSTVSLVSSSGVVSTSYGGVGVRSQWTPDSQTVYITTTGNTLLTHSTSVNWQATDTTITYRDVAVTVPGVGAYFAGGNRTEGRTYCPTTTIVSGSGNPPTASNQFFTLADTNNAQTDRLAATTDGKHILGAGFTSGAATLNDIAYTLPASALACTQTTGQVMFASSLTTTPLASITPAGAGSITGVVPATNSGLTFITYIGTSGLLPYYIPAATGVGTLKYLTLGNGATAASAPVAGVFATDNQTFYAGTSGDNQVHLVGVSGGTATESGVINPKLPDLNNNPATPNLIVQRPKRATS